MVESFLKTYELVFLEEEFQLYVDKVVAEMEKGLVTQSSFMMFPTYLSVGRDVAYNEPIVVMDAGGTNLRVAVVTLRKDKEPKIQHFKKVPMPGTDRLYGREEFFDALADLLIPLLSYSDTVGFCFSFPTELTPELDAKLVYISKELKIPEVVGHYMGEGVNEALQRKGHPTREFHLLNDTVATLLAGVAVYGIDGGISSHIGLVLGTGLNTCYMEDVENIQKNPECAHHTGKMLINMESGGFSGFPQGQLDKMFDATTINPGEFTFEKMISGAYLGGLARTCVGQGAKDQLFSLEFAQKLEGITEFPLWEMDAFCQDPYKDHLLGRMVHTEEDRILLLGIFRQLYTRQAWLVTILLTGIMKKIDAGSDPEKPVLITAEGTTFYKSSVFQTALTEYMTRYAQGQQGRYSKFVHVNDATLLGTAMAGLL